MTFKKTTWALAALMVLATPYAFATPGNNGDGNGGCGAGQSTNGCGNTGNPGTVNNGGSAVAGALAAAGAYAEGGKGGSASAQGGTGGAGGQGGAGGAGGTGIGGSVVGSGNSANTNLNANTASNRNDIHNSQSQGQGQDQTAVGIGGSAHSSSGGNSLSGTQANGQSVTVTGDTVTYQAQARQPVATAYAPNIMPTAVCMGSTSVGGQGITFGISVGTSWTDGNCQLLEQVRTTASVLGDTSTAAQMMCAVPAYAKAREATGRPCDKPAAKPTTTSSAEPEPVHESATEAGLRKKYAYYGNDPIVMSRLGIAPLTK